MGTDVLEVPRYRTTARPESPGTTAKIERLVKQHERIIRESFEEAMKADGPEVGLDELKRRNAQ